jgi:hypothetical protein
MCDSQLLPELDCSVNALRRPGLLQLVGNRDLEMKTENKKRAIGYAEILHLRKNAVNTQSIGNSFTQKYANDTHPYAFIRNFFAIHLHQYAISIRRNTRSIRIDRHYLCS